MCAQAKKKKKNEIKEKNPKNSEFVFSWIKHFKYFMYTYSSYSYNNLTNVYYIITKRCDMVFKATWPKRDL